ncbi:MAG TPA: FtsQ-type POTRA domain-containing protein [Gaiellaceae bacterium]|nr:FtsQ-type POTRA domain-containing protein [Gaiellaceae bacterium]
MARQPALVLARPRAVSLPQGAWRRAVLIAACAVAVLGLLYLGARETPVFALRTVEVEGVSGPVRASVLREVDDLRGESLVALDGRALVRRLEALPSVQSVTYDRAFPHTLQLVVQPERPVAVIEQQPGSAVVSVRGRVISRVVGNTPALPRIRELAPGDLAPGAFVADPAIRTVLTALGEAPKHMLLPIHRGRFVDGELTFVLAGEGDARPLLKLGEPTDVRTKLRAAALVLRTLNSEELALLAYLDVSLPDRVVTSSNPQVSG